MSRIILSPDLAIKAKWGALAHVAPPERQRILDLPAMKFKPEIEALKREIKEAERWEKIRVKAAAGQ